MTCVINFVRAMAAFGSMFLIPLFLQNLWNTRPGYGIILLPTAVSVAVVIALLWTHIRPYWAKIPWSPAPSFSPSLYMYKDISFNSDYCFYSGLR